MHIPLEQIRENVFLYPKLANGTVMEHRVFSSKERRHSCIIMTIITVMESLRFGVQRRLALPLCWSNLSRKSITFLLMLGIWAG